MSTQVRYGDLPQKFTQTEKAMSTHLILDEKFNSLNGSGSSLGDPGSDSGEHEVLSKSQLLARHDGYGAR